MPTTSTYIITKNASGNLMSTLASSGYDIDNNLSLDPLVAQVLTVHEDRSITFNVLNNNLNNSISSSLSIIGNKAKPLNPHMTRLPVEGEIVKLHNIPDPFSISNNPAQFRTIICYDNPLPSWDDINNNIIQNNNVISNISNINVNITSYKQSDLGFT